jgi:hypothetical protein
MQNVASLIELVPAGLLAWLGFRAERLKFCFLNWGGAALLTIAVSSRALPGH